ncbi:MAG: type I methionyl aminopeptidase [Enterovibrio sp.]
MAPTIKNGEEIERMRLAGRLAAQTLDMISGHVKAGISTDELNAICHRYITDTLQATPATLNFHGFPKSICTSLNNVVCNGVPKSNEIIRSGDILNIHISLIKNGFHSATSKMFLIDDVSAEDKALCHVVEQSLYHALKKIKAGKRVCDIGTQITQFVKTRPRRYSIVKEYCGHGIGVELHEAPQIMHCKNSDDTVLQAGMCLAIKPMINLGSAATRVDEQDNWTIYTLDGKRSAQWEHTVLITTTGVEILTWRAGENISRVLHNSH